MKAFLSVALLLAGCSASDATDDGGLDDPNLADLGGPFEPDVGELDAGGCQYADAEAVAPSAGERCYCDGAFIVRGELVYRLGIALEVIDISDPRTPTLVASVPQQASFSFGLAIVGDVLFAAGGALERFDISNPRAPVSMGVIELGGRVTALASDDTQLVVAVRREDDTGALVAIDASAPLALHVGEPIELGRSEVRSLVRRGGITFAVIADLDGPVQVAALDLLTSEVLDLVRPPDGGGVASRLVLHRGLLFVSSLAHGVSVYDARDPRAIRELGMDPLGLDYVYSLATTGDRLIVLGNGAWLYDATNPEALAPLGHLRLIQDPAHAAVHGEYLLVSGINGLAVIPLLCE